MLGALEDIAREQQFTIHALTAFGTLAAVIVSLCVAIWGQRAQRTKLRASVAVHTMIHDSIPAGERPKFICVTILNVGNSPLWIGMSFFYFRMPFQREMLLLTPMDYSAAHEHVPQRTYPTEIPPRRSEFFFMTTLPMFKQEMSRTMPKSSGWLSRYRWWRLRAVVVSADGREFACKMERSMRTQLRALRSGITPVSDS